jgi:uncharacterized protein
MHISEDRISHLAHRIIDALWREDLADLPDERRSLQCVKDAVARYFEVGDEIDSSVRAKLASYRPPKTPGSREYDILYQKFYQEEQARRKR